MRILADENVPSLVVHALRQAGHDVRWVRTDAPGSSDRQVIQLAVEQSRLVMTLDKDFGELVFREGRAAWGIVLLRSRVPSPDVLARLTVAAFTSRDDWQGHFSIIEDDRIRMRPLLR